MLKKWRKSVVNVKKCSKCKAEKNLDEFYRSSKSKDGRKSSCKSCVKKQYKKKCVICDVDFYTAHKNAKVCSAKCAAIYNSGEKHHSRKNKQRPSRVEFNCYYCGKKHTQCRSLYEKSKTHYCSKECAYKGISRFYTGENRYNYSKKTCTCMFCGEEFLRKKHHAERRNGNNFCSKTCFSKWCSQNLIKDARYNFNPEKTIEERIACRDTQNDILFRKGVFERDNYTCVVTKQIGGDLVAHHLDGYDWCLDKRYDVSNGVTLSKQIHTEFHKKYGFGKNTKEQFDEFCKSYENNYGNTEVTS